MVPSYPKLTMPGVPFLLPIEFDLAAASLMAVTGVWAAGRRGYDLVGAAMLAFVTGVGGGLLRDGIFLQVVPVVMQDSAFLWAILAALVIGALTQRLAERFEKLIAYIDALAIGVYSVYGANKALIAGITPEAAIIVGICNAVGGGLIRDVLVREEPLVFKPGQLYVVAALAGCIPFVVMTYYYEVSSDHAAWIAISVTMLLRVLSIRFNWTTKPVSNWDIGRPRD